MKHDILSIYAIIIHINYILPLKKYSFPDKIYPFVDVEIAGLERLQLSSAIPSLRKGDFRKSPPLKGDKGGC